jgi:hypothetical protein
MVNPRSKKTSGGIKKNLWVLIMMIMILHVSISQSRAIGAAVFQKWLSVVVFTKEWKRGAVEERMVMGIQGKTHISSSPRCRESDGSSTHDARKGKGEHHIS